MDSGSMLQGLAYFIQSSLLLPPLSCQAVKGPSVHSDSPSGIVERAQKRSWTVVQDISDSLVQRQLLSMESEAENRSLHATKVLNCF